MQPPPCADGMTMLPVPPRLPLWAKKDPSPLMLVSVPSKIGELVRLSWYVNQFQYYNIVAQ